MLLLCLLAIQFAMSYGDLMCMYTRYPRCYEAFSERSDLDYCASTPQTIDCMKGNAIECNVENSALVMDMEQRLMETCQEGTELNKAYLQHRTCVFHLSLKAAAPCYMEVASAILNYPVTGNKDEDTLGMFKLSCGYDDQINRCLSDKVAENCGGEAVKFYHKFFGPSNDLVTRACMESGAASFDFARTLLLQASAILFALQFFKLTV